jgi:hypothetical protein
MKIPGDINIRNAAEAAASQHLMGLQTNGHQ